MKFASPSLRSGSPEGTGVSQGPKKGSRGVVAFVLMALILLAAFILIVPHVPAALNSGNDIFSQLASAIQNNSGTTTATRTSVTTYVPLIIKGSANVSYPSDYSTLQAYALDLINQDRASNGTAPVSLSNNRAGQQHANSMLTYGYFSHWDTQGFKPYMRYSLLGGDGGDFENIGYILDSSAHFNTASVKTAIKDLEFAMMHNDSACCNNGHMKNILDPLHNKVSIGITYDDTQVYFVQEFENDYMTLNFSVSGSNYVTFSGVPLQPSVTSRSNSIYIYYDPTPSPETTAQLNSSPNEYDAGTFVGGVLPPCTSILGCPQFNNGITVYADTWKFDSNQVSVAFSLNNFIKQRGAGVYTLYLVTGSDTNSAIITTSVFVS